MTTNQDTATSPQAPEQELVEQAQKPAKRVRRWKRWVWGSIVLGVVGGVAVLPRAYPLPSAIKDKNWLYAQTLIILGADVNRKTSSGKSLLKEAFDNREPRIVEFLLDQPGIDTSAWTPLCLAVLCHDSEQVEQLLAEGQDVNAPDSYHLNDFSSLELAILANDVEAVKKLLREGGFSSYTTSELNSALSWAVFAGNKACMEALIGAGAHIDAELTSGRQLFMAAMEKGDSETVRLVLMHTRRLDRVAAEGMRCLARRGGDATSLELFIKVGVSPVSGEEGFCQPLNDAEEHEHVECVRLLMQLGATLVAKDNDGNTALAQAEQLDDSDLEQAWFNLGCCYYHGHGVKQDKKQTNKWFRKAAEKGHPVAAKFIGH